MSILSPLLQPSSGSRRSHWILSFQFSLVISTTYSCHCPSVSKVIGTLVFPILLPLLPALARSSIFAAELLVLARIFTHFTSDALDMGVSMET